MARSSGGAGVPPAWTSVLAVIAHLDDASMGRGAAPGPADLATLRGDEPASASDVQGAVRLEMRDGPGGALREVCQRRLASEVVATADSCDPEALVVFVVLSVTGHLDHVAATAAGLLAAETLGLSVLGRALSQTVGARLSQDFGARVSSHREEGMDLRVTADRARPHWASRANAGQPLPGSACRRRLELLAETTSLRWLRA